MSPSPSNWVFIFLVIYCSSLLHHSTSSSKRSLGWAEYNRKWSTNQALHSVSPEYRHWIKGMGCRNPPMHKHVAVAHLVGIGCYEGCGLCNRFHLRMRTVPMDNLAQAGYYELCTVNRWSCMLAMLSHDCDIKHTCYYNNNIFVNQSQAWTLMILASAWHQIFNNNTRPLMECLQANRCHSVSR